MTIFCRISVVLPIYTQSLQTNFTDENWGLNYRLRIGNLKILLCSDLKRNIMGQNFKESVNTTTDLAEIIYFSNKIKPYFIWYENVANDHTYCKIIFLKAWILTICDPKVCSLKQVWQISFCFASGNIKITDLKNVSNCKVCWSFVALWSSPVANVATSSTAVTEIPFVWTNKVTAFWAAFRTFGFEWSTNARRADNADFRFGSLFLVVIFCRFLCKK